MYMVEYKCILYTYIVDNNFNYSLKNSGKNICLLVCFMLINIVVKGVFNLCLFVKYKLFYHNFTFKKFVFINRFKKINF